MNSTIDLQEVEKFSRIADEWWNKNGKFKPLHKFNPVRINFIRRKIIELLVPIEEKNTKQSSESESFELKPFVGLKILDVGCGGGLVSESLACLGASVVAIDASQKNIEAAKIHAEKSQLKIDYRISPIEELQQEEKFDVVLALEVIEHVADVENFIKHCSLVTKKNGLVFFATINRNLKSLALAKIGAEYLLRWLPIGTHDWKKFLKPSEINTFAYTKNLNLIELRGFSYNIFSDDWKESTDIAVNYCAVFKKS